MDLLIATAAILDDASVGHRQREGFFARPGQRACGHRLVELGANTASAVEGALIAAWLVHLYTASG